MCAITCVLQMIWRQQSSLFFHRKEYTLRFWEQLIDPQPAKLYVSIYVDICTYICMRAYYTNIHAKRTTCWTSLRKLIINHGHACTYAYTWIPSVSHFEWRVPEILQTLSDHGHARAHTRTHTAYTHTTHAHAHTYTYTQHTHSTHTHTHTLTLTLTHTHTLSLNLSLTPSLTHSLSLSHTNSQHTHLHWGVAKVSPHPVRPGTQIANISNIVSGVERPAVDYGTKQVVDGVLGAFVWGIAVAEGL